MQGQPVWLCSVSHYDKTGLLTTGTWSKDDFALAERLAHSALAGVGNPARERGFRMNITFCIHRAINAEEETALPTCWSGAEGALAGGPVEVLWSRGIPHCVAAMPCVNPGRMIIDERRPDLWVPTDCGECEPCRGRIAASEISLDKPTR